MDKNLKKAVKEQIKQETPLKIQKFYESVLGWKILLVIDIILSWFLEKVFHVNPSASLLDIIQEKKEDKLPFLERIFDMFCYRAGFSFIFLYYTKVF